MVNWIWRCLAVAVVLWGALSACVPQPADEGKRLPPVGPNVIVSIQLTPAISSIAAGTWQPYTATGVHADSTTLDLTTTASWTSDNPAVATVEPKGIAIANTAGGPVTIKANFGGLTETAQLTVTPASLQSIQVTPASANITNRTTKQFTATGFYTDSTTQDLTALVSWSSSNTAVATISAAGLATGVAAGGPVTITATNGGKSGQAQLTVTPATLQSILLTPGIASIAKGATQRFTATGIYIDSTTQDLTSLVSWNSSNTAIATITGGLATGVAAGNLVTITAAFGGKTGMAQLTVTAATLESILVTPATASIPAGTTQQFTATGNYTDASTQDLTAQVSWSSSSTTLATISASGLAAGVAVGGPVTITAAFGGKTGTAQLTVGTATLVSMQVTPATASIPVGTAPQFTATGTYSDSTTQDLTAQVSWSSSNTAVATISASGLAAGVAAGGPLTITAAFGGKTGTAQLTVTAAPDSWATKAPMPTAREGLAAAEVNGIIYAIGGTSDNGSTLLNTVEAYDSVTNTWSAKAPLPTARAYLAAVAVNNIIYAIGGAPVPGGCATAVEAYNPATDSWSSKAPMPTARYAFGAAAINGIIFALSGSNCGAGSVAEAYDPVTNAWSSKAPMPDSRGYTAAAAANSAVFVLGGNSGVTTVDGYTPANDTWSAEPPMPTGRRSLAAATVNGQVFAIGGDFGRTANESFDPIANTWTVRSPMPTGRYGPAAAVVAGTIYVIGGGTSPCCGIVAPSNTVEAFTPAP